MHGYIATASQSSPCYVDHRVVVSTLLVNNHCNNHSQIDTLIYTVRSTAALFKVN